MRHPWRRVSRLSRESSGGPPTLAWGVSKPRSALLGVWGNFDGFDGLSTLRVACSHHAYTDRVGTEMVTCGFAHDS